MFLSHLERLRKNKITLITFLVLLLFPSLEIIQILLHINLGGRVPDPWHAFFLAGYSNFGTFQSIYFWFLPIYLLILIADDSIIEFKTGYYNIIRGKCTKAKYCLEKVGTSFLVSFLTVFLSLSINLLLVHVFFHGGTYNHYIGIELSNPFFEMCLNHPVITDLCYLLLVSILVGICGALAATCSLFFKNKKITYVIAFALWFIFLIQHKSLMLVFQPYTEYPFTDLLEILLCYVITFVGTIVTFLVCEIKCNDLE